MHGTFNQATWEKRFNEIHGAENISHISREYLVTVRADGGVVFMITRDLTPSQVTGDKPTSSESLITGYDDIFRALAIYGYSLKLVASVVYGVFNNDEIAKAFNACLPGTVEGIMKRYYAEFYG